MVKQKKWMLMGLLVMMLITLPSISFAAAQDFTLVNKSGYDITGFWVAPADDDSWGDNILSSNEVLHNGDSMDIVFDKADRTTHWNFSITDSKGKEWKWENKSYDLTKISVVTYSYKNGKGWLNFE